MRELNKNRDPDVYYDYDQVMALDEESYGKFFEKCKVSRFLPVVKDNGRRTALLRNRSNLIMKGEDYDKVSVSRLVLRVYDSTKGYNIIRFVGKTSMYLLESWMEYIGEISEDFIPLKVPGKGANFLTKSGEFLCEDWFEEVDSFREGIAKVKVSNGWTFIDEKGLKVTEETFLETGTFQDMGTDSFTWVRTEGGFLNLITRTGRLILPEEGVDEIGNIQGNYFPIRKGDKYNFVGIDEKILCEEWYDQVRDMNPNTNFASIWKAEKGWNVIDERGVPISPTWFDKEPSTRELLPRVFHRYKVGYLYRTGELVGNQWFDSLSYLGKVLTGRVEGRGWNFVDVDTGEFTSPFWFTSVSPPKDSVRKVYKEGMGWNFVDKNGKLLFDVWTSKDTNVVQHIKLK